VKQDFVARRAFTVSGRGAWLARNAGADRCASQPSAGMDVQEVSGEGRSRPD
jgi:hypothetical protein